MRGHGLWMILGCTLPLLLVFLLPLLGISGNVRTLLFIVLMFACHLMAMRGHDGTHRSPESTRGGHHGIERPCASAERSRKGGRPCPKQIRSASESMDMA